MVAEEGEEAVVLGGDRDYAFGLDGFSLGVDHVYRKEIKFVSWTRIDVVVCSSR